MTSDLPRRAMLVAAGFVAVAGNAAADTVSDLQKIMDTYATALKAGDVETLVGLYSPKGEFMREEMKAVVGQDALRAAYKEAFAALKVDLQFTIREAEEAGDMAWLRSVSKGTVKILKTGVDTKQGYNQLVVFRKEGGAWKIRAYLYGSNRPEPGQTPT
jgi:ketosteroid isomerase-like protein